MRLESLPLCPVYLEVSLPGPGGRDVGLGLSVRMVSDRGSSFVRFHWAHGRGPVGPGWRGPSFRTCCLGEAVREAARVVSADVREEDVSCFERQLRDPVGLALALAVMGS